MKHLKFTLILVCSIMAVNFSKAQTIEDGKKFLYYDKFISAKNVFQQLLTANPNNDAAAYWLGQTLIAPDEDKDIDGAKAVYQKALATNPNSALLNAGMGHIELLEGKTAEARNHFETALSLGGKNNVDVLDAVGFANGDFDSKSGDAAYAVEKLKQATETKKFKDAKVMTDLGDAYRKLGDGGNAQASYQEAMKMDPNYARAAFRLGRIYQSQGRGQEALYLKYYNDAIAMDPNYTKVYWILYQYFYETDVVKSAAYLDKYLGAKGSDETNACFLNAQMKFAQGLFAEALTSSDNCISASTTPYPNLYGLKAYAAVKLGDTINAKNSFEKYFQVQKPAKIGPRDFATYASVLWGFQGNEAKVAEYIDKAVALDTLNSNKAGYLKWLAGEYVKKKNYADAGILYGRVINVKPNYSNVDLFNAGYNFYLADKYDSSNRYFALYTEKYPDDILGYYMLGNGYSVIDSTGALGLAIPYFNKTIEIGEKDTTKSTTITRLKVAYKFFVGYYFNVKKDKDSALLYVNRALALDPTDESMISNKEFILKTDPNAPPKQAAKKSQAPSSPKKK
ncbi:MAG: tetratricopeptide repeat protein [Bacteroidetes bacterium]|nr:tetratricopeptide repeat protein [Bacteroidota bacterium]